MPKTRFVFSIAVAALLVATPAMGQLGNYPITALPAGDADGATSLGFGWGRGLNDTSGKLNAFGVGIARAMETVSFGVGGSFIDAASSEIAVGGKVAYNLPASGTTESVDFGIQGGIEWVSPEGATQLNFPIGVTARGSLAAGSGAIPLWIYPRWQWTRTSPETGDSSTESTPGVATGTGYVTEGGWGLSLSVDWTRIPGAANSKVNSFLFGAAVIYQLP